MGHDFRKVADVALRKERLDGSVASTCLTKNRFEMYYRGIPMRFVDSCVKKLGFLLSDKLYLSLRYRCLIGQWIDWKHPKRFTEKLQWLKVYNYKPEYTCIVDKLAVKDYVADCIGKEYIIPTLEIWDRVDDIDWDALPDQFVLKTTHGGGGGGVVVCPDKSRFNKEEAIEKLSVSMRTNAGKTYREKPYLNVPRKILAETYIKPEASADDCQSTDLYDYKFFCFNGEVNFFKVDFGRFIEHHANYYDIDGNMLNFGEADFSPLPNYALELPENLKEMIKLAEQLSKGEPFLRVDLYNVRGKIYFGELTLYPASGFGKWTPDETDFKIGDMLVLP